jgi:hypothetical protein
MSNSRPGGDNPDDSSETHQSYWRWRKSSFSTSNGDCIEVASLTSNHVGVRDSKAVANPYLRFPVGAWAAFVGDIKRACPAAGADSVL